MATKAEMAAELETLREQVQALKAAAKAAQAPIRPVCDAPQDAMARAKAAVSSDWKRLYARYYAETQMPRAVKADVIEWAQEQGYPIPR